MGQREGFGLAFSGHRVSGWITGLRSDRFNQKCDCGVPYGSRTRVAAVKEKGPIVIQCNFAAWIALDRI